MSRDGPASSTLSERLAAKLEADRQQVEELTLSEHRKLAQSFLDASKAELDTIRNAIHAQSLTTVQSVRVLLRWPLWTAASCIVMVIASLALLWAGTWWTRNDLEQLRSAVMSERQALTDLTSQTHGIRFTASDKGTFLVLPASADATTQYTCGNRTCIRVGK
jgi:hypothetical protein